MISVHVFVHVKKECVTDFKNATFENARKSLLEPGVARFDVAQQADDPSRFILIEMYRSPEAVAAHKETAHYAVWRDTVASMMETPRQSIKYTTLFPLNIE